MFQFSRREPRAVIKPRFSVASHYKIRKLRASFDREEEFLRIHHLRGSKSLKGDSSLEGLKIAVLREFFFKKKVTNKKERGFLY